MGKRWGWLGILMLAMSTAMIGCGGGGPGAPEDTTPPSITDKTPPTITDVQVNPSSLIEQGRQVTVQATVSDDLSGIKSVVAKVRYPDGSVEEKTMSSQQADPNNYSVTFTARWDSNRVGTDPTEWFVQVMVEAVDVAGNKAQSSESRVRAAAAIPPPPPF